MKTLIITQEEPFYLPVFMDRLLGSYHDIIAMVSVAPDSSFFSQIRERYRLFGPRDFTMYGTLYLHHRIMDSLGSYSKGNRPYSIRAVAQKKSVPYYQLRNINEAESLRLLSSFAPEIILSVACPQIIRKPLMDMSRYCINIHGALLPENRGRMPSFWALAKGEAITGVTVHFIDESVDTGNIIAQKPIEISKGETWHSLQQKVVDVGVTVLLEALNKIENGDGAGVPQRSGGSYNTLPSKEAIRDFRLRGYKFI